MHEQEILKADQLIKEHTGEGTHCVLSLIDADGSPTASAITVSKSGGIRWLTFCTGLASNKAIRIRKNSRASICFCSETYNITLVGSISIETDPEYKREMWYAGMSNHFSGPDDPNYCVLRFTTERYSLLIDWEEVSGNL